MAATVIKARGVEGNQGDESAGGRKGAVKLKARNVVKQKKKAEKQRAKEAEKQEKVRKAEVKKGKSKAGGGMKSLTIKGKGGNAESHLLHQMPEEGKGNGSDGNTGSEDEGKEVTNVENEGSADKKVKCARRGQGQGELNGHVQV
jgi:hypothetical protein